MVTTRERDKCIYFFFEWFYFLNIGCDCYFMFTYPNFCASKVTFKVRKQSFIDFSYYYICAEVWINEAWNINPIQSEQKLSYSRKNMSQPSHEACYEGYSKSSKTNSKNTLFMKFTKLFFYIVSIQFITSLTEVLWIGWKLCRKIIL